MQIRALVPLFLLSTAAWAAEAPAARVVLPDTVRPTHYAIAVEPDVAGLAFKATADIEITVVRPADKIVLNAADLVIDRVALDAAGEVPAVTYNEQEQTVTLGFSHAIAAGAHQLRFAYHGKIYQQASGLFALDYDGAHGKQRGLYTQFENSDARRFVPCWDEPGIKATFLLTAIVPAGQMALSNMPVAATEALPDGRQRVRFATTPLMSSYLLFFGLGDFERVHRAAAGVDVGIVVRRGDTAKAALALEVACELLPYYNDYFGVPYPLPKLDLIAAPGQSQFFGAMENWGAIFYFDRVLLFDPKVSTEKERQNVYGVIAHEMAHQWFGDLVTMAWWDDLWLNEGFASWMASKATDHFHPEWNVWLRALGSKQNAMSLDERNGTHAVVTPITDVFQASGAFDAITYQKGEAVIRMFESYVGEDSFRAGVRAYMKRHAYGNTVTDDLWREIDAVSPRKLTDIAHDFTLQAGVPLVTATAAGGILQLRQERFAVDASGNTPAQWRIPVIALPADGRELKTAKRLVVTPNASATVEGAPLGTVVNGGQTGYFRTKYEGAAFTALLGRYATLSPDDQLGLLNDLSTLGSAGRTPMSDSLELASRLPLEADPVVWNDLVDKLASINRLYEGLPTRAAFQVFARRLLAPKFADVGWDARAGESGNTVILRDSLLRTLGQLGDPDVVAEARRRFQKFLQDPATQHGTARATMLGIVAANADPATWEQLHQLAVRASSEIEKNDYYAKLGDAADSALSQRALDLALSDELTPTLRPALVSSVAKRHADLAFDYMAGHWDVLSQSLETSSRNLYAPRVATWSLDRGMIPKLEAFADAHIPASARQDVRKAVAYISYAVNVRENRLPEIDRWLAARAAAAK